MILLEAGATIAGRAGTAASLTVTIFGQEALNQADQTRGAGKRLYQGQVPAADTVLYTVPDFTTTTVRHIAVANPTGGAVTLKLWQGGITDPFLILPAVSILAGGFAMWRDGEWTFYDSAGKIQVPVGSGGGSALTTQEAGVTLDAATTKVNFLAGFDLTNPVAGEADVALDASEVAAAPTSSAVGDASATGAAATFANSGHRHAREGFGSPVASAVGDAGADGTATTEARSDHKHGREAFGSPVASAVGDTAADGTATTEARSDHRHAREAFGSPGSSAVGDTAADGTAVTEARADHRHAREGFGSPAASAVGDTAADGTATTEARADHRHAREGFAAPGSSAVGDSVNAGVATTEARSDHRHGREAFGSPVATAAANADGTATTEARADHVHQTGAPPAHGAAEHTDITRSLWIPAPYTGTLDAATAGSVGAVPNKLDLDVMADAATQGFYTQFQMPLDAKAASAITVTIYWVPSATVAATAVRFTLTAKALVAGSDPSAAGTGTSFTGSAANKTANQLVIEAATQALASVNAGEIIMLEVQRIGADAADTYTGTCRVVGVKIEYTATQ